MSSNEFSNHLAPPLRRQGKTGQVTESITLDRRSTSPWTPRTPVWMSATNRHLSRAECTLWSACGVAPFIVAACNLSKLIHDFENVLLITRATYLLLWLCHFLSFSSIYACCKVSFKVVGSVQFTCLFSCRLSYASRCVEYTWCGLCSWFELVGKLWHLVCNSFASVVRLNWGWFSS